MYIYIYITNYNYFILKNIEDIERKKYYTKKINRKNKKLKEIKQELDLVTKHIVFLKKIKDNLGNNDISFLNKVFI